MSLTVIRCLAISFGLLMAATAAVHANGLALASAAVSAAAVVVGARFAAAATVAVAASAIAISVADPAPTYAALAGVCAAAYLVLRHTSGAQALTLPTMVGALGMATIGYLAAAIPFELPWLPLAAPVLLFGVYAIVLRPLM